MDKQLFKWHAKCADDCANNDGILKLFFVTETEDTPELTCGPCGNRPITDVSFVESYTITE